MRGKKLSYLIRNASRSAVFAILTFMSVEALPAEDLTKVSGYLGPEVYAMLEEVDIADGRKVKRWIGPKLNFANYKSVLIEDVILFPEPQPGPQVSQETLDAVKDYLTEKLQKKVSSVLKVAPGTGPEVLRMQTAVTGVKITVEGMKAYEVLPVAAVFGGLEALSGERDENVVVFVEFKLSDSVTGEMVGAAVRRVEGEKLKNAKDQLLLEHLQDNLDTVADEAQSTMSHVLGEEG
jgi:O-succinylbenzoate synthase